MSFDANRYSTNYIQQCLIKDAVDPPIPERAGEFIDALQAIYDVHKQAGVEGARTSWQTIKKFVPELDKKQKLFNFNDLHMIQRPQYALPYSEDGTAPPYAIYLNGLNAIYGQPGCGKTFVAMDFSKRLALAYPDNSVIFCAGEGVSGLNGRSEAWNHHFKATPRNMYLWDEAVPLLNPEAVEEFVANVADLNPNFIVIDTLARAMAGENENDTSIMSKFIIEAEKLQRRLDCGILLIHHTGRAGYIRGSSVLDGAMDSMLKLQASDTTISIYNSLEHGGKNKHNPEIKVIRLQILPVEFEFNGEHLSEAVVVPSDKVIDEPISDLSDNQRLILEFLFDVGESVQANQIIESVDMNRRTIFRNLKKLEESQLIEKTDNGIYSITTKGVESLGM